MIIFAKIILSILLADFLSGVGHWLEDTYGDPNSKLFGELIVKPNLKHHLNQREFLKKSYWRRNDLQIIVGVISITLLCVFNALYLMPILTILILSQVNEIHAMAHRTKEEIPEFFQMLQEMGMLQSINHHRHHHVAPYECKFCIITNFLNPVLDRIGFWTRLEKGLSKVGIRVLRGTAVRGGY